MLYVIFSSVAYTLSAVEETGRVFFLIWISLIYFCNAGIYGIMPSAIGRIYGNKYLGINYGLTYSSQVSIVQWVSTVSWPCLSRVHLHRYPQ